MTLTVGTIAKMGLELVLGVSIKLFCDNGRVHWADFANDYLWWATGRESLGGSGIGRQAFADLAVAGFAPAAPAVAVEVEVEEELPLAAK